MSSPPPLCPVRCHAAWAREQRSAGFALARQPQADCPLSWLLCPQLAAAVFGEYDGGADGLAKAPPVRQLLLGCSLTGVSGADWARQRPAVVAAAGGGLSVQAARHAAAAADAAALALQLSAAGQVPDSLAFAQAVAARGVSRAVLGAGAAARAVEEALLAFLRAQRAPLPQRSADDCVALEGQLASALDAALAAASPADETVLGRLLGQAALSRREALCNAASCLLAGCETTSLLLACCLLHLAQRPDVQAAAAASAPLCWASPAVAAIARETLRLHPPVMGQPRQVTRPGGVAGLPQGARLSASLLSAAHGAPPGGGDS